MIVIKFFGIVVAMAMADWCWTKYMLAAAEKEAFKAAAWSSSIVAISAVSVISYVEDIRLAPAACIGAFIGTYYAVVHGSKKE
jgi:hypothetical protein